MLFGRQKLLLSLLDAIGGAVGNLDYQKLLLLYTREFEQEPSFDFVPYRYGAFSFTSYADKRSLMRKGLLVNDDGAWQLTSAGKTEATKAWDYHQQVKRFCHYYGQLRGNALVEFTYKKYPYFAICSEIINQVLTDNADYERVEAARPARRPPGLATIGYEGKSLESYLNLLLKDGVSLLCDVRRNPISRKYGFSKNTLQHACEGLGIRYVHMPELGIASEDRQHLETKADYTALFIIYKRDELSKQGASIRKIARWVAEGSQRVALTCYELQPEQCHRHCVAEAVYARLGKDYDIDHL
ncbi:MAG: DUF488 domain-containing protein [Nitrospirota bacterium]|nr:DUF488 domain-containing protein [Nitrospirota bacterium]